MADVVLTITIPDAVVDRVKEALDATTKSQAEAWVKQRIKDEVIGHESQKARDLAEADIKTAREAQDQAEQTARESAEADIAL